MPNSDRHRRLSSVGRSRRRLSDARDAAARPVPSLQTAAASLAALSLASPSPPQPIHPHPDDTPRRRARALFTCESCSKVYRHPSCLIKHRWEHTPQWREASKFVLSKHQQVQLLEAAAILSHLSPSSASLPEDRSLWPSFLSGGLVPPPGTRPSPHPISSSVPTASPHLHDYSATQVRLGAAEDDARNLLALSGARARGSHSHSASYSHPLSHPHSHSPSTAHAKARERRRSNAYEYTYTQPTGWSLPRSSVRAQSGSRSRSDSSESRSEDEEEEEEEDQVDPPTHHKVEQWDGMEMEMEMD